MRTSLVRRNDEITVAEAEALAPSHLVISPGPCTPAEAGISNSLIERLGPRIPTLGVCLGHQCIGAVFGGARRACAASQYTARSRRSHHRRRGHLSRTANPFAATRYHSLIVER